VPGTVAHSPNVSEPAFDAAGLAAERARVRCALVKAEREYDRALRRPRCQGVEDAEAELRGLDRRLRELDELEGRVS
jgi:hypothetical protein